jgi:hypothetical protein
MIALFNFAICQSPFAKRCREQHAGSRKEPLEARLDLFWRFPVDVVADGLRKCAKRGRLFQATARQCRIRASLECRAARLVRESQENRQDKTN